MSELLVAPTSTEAGDFIRRSPCKCGSTRKRRLVDSGQPAAAPSPSGGRFLHLSTGEKYLARGVREFASLGPRPYPGVAPEGLRRNAIMHPLDATLAQSRLQSGEISIGYNAPTIASEWCFGAISVQFRRKRSVK